MRRFSKLLCLLLAAASLHAEILLTVNKTAFESFTCSMDFTQVIGSDGLTIVSVTATNIKTGANTTAIVISTSPAPSVLPGTDKVAFRVQSGTVGDTHQISVKISDNSNGQQFEGNMQLTIASE